MNIWGTCVPIFSYEDWYEEGMYSELWELTDEALEVMYEAYVQNCHDNDRKKQEWEWAVEGGL